MSKMTKKEALPVAMCLIEMCKMLNEGYLRIQHMKTERLNEDSTYENPPEQAAEWLLGVFTSYNTDPMTVLYKLMKEYDLQDELGISDEAYEKYKTMYNGGQSNGRAN